jgi:hypothetical protein
MALEGGPAPVVPLHCLASCGLAVLSARRSSVPMRQGAHGDSARNEGRKPPVSWFPIEGSTSNRPAGWPHPFIRLLARRTHYA